MSLDAEQIMEEGVVVGTRNPTGDFLLLDCRFEMPYGMLLQPQFASDLIDDEGPSRKNFSILLLPRSALMQLGGPLQIYSKLRRSC